MTPVPLGGFEFEDVGGVEARARGSGGTLCTGATGGGAQA